MSENKKHIIGIVGGMGTLAGLNFTQRFINTWTAEKNVKKEWDYPKFILYSNPKMPSRTLGILNNEDEPLISLLEDIVLDLLKVGVSQIFVTCNTAHYFLRKSEKIKGLFVDLIKLTIDESNSASLHVLAGEGTIEAKLYDNDQKPVTYSSSTNLRYFIELIKQNKDLTKKDLKLFKGMLSPTSCNVMGCTEFSVIYSKYKHEFENFEIIDPIEVTIDYIIKNYE